MEEIKNSIQELEILLNSINQNQNIETVGDPIQRLFTSDHKSVKQLKDELKLLEEDFKTASTKPMDFKSELINRMVNIKAQALYYINNGELSRALNEQLDEIERKAERIINSSLDLSQSSDELLIIKEEYDAILNLGKKSKTTLDNYNIEMTIAKAIVKVMSLKIADGIEVDLNKEIDKKYAHETLLHIQEQANTLLNEGTEQQKEIAKKLLEKIKMTAFTNAKNGLENIENLVYDKELMKKFFSLTGSKDQIKEALIKTDTPEEQSKEDIESQSFEEYRKKKIAYYQALTGKKNIEPKKWQITIITDDNKVKKLTNKRYSKAYFDGNGFPLNKYQPIAIIFGEGARIISGSYGAYPKSIQDVILNDGLNEIGVGAFSNTEIKELVLPPTVEEIDTQAFENCHNLKHVKFNEGLKKIGKGAFLGCSKLKNIVLSEDLQIIGPSAFERTDIEEIKMPQSLKIIWEKAFYCCKKLRKVVLNEGLEIIGDSAFERTAIEEIKMPKSLRGIGAAAFYFCEKLRNVELNDGLETIEDSAFQATNAGEIPIPRTVKKVGKLAFKTREQKHDQTEKKVLSSKQVLIERIHELQKELAILQKELNRKNRVDFMETRTSKENDSNNEHDL